MEIPTNQTPQQNQKTAGKGLFGILLAGFVILLFLFLLILNYFNILPLSKLFPNYLGFLPHKPYEGTQNKENSTEKPGFPTSIPSLTEKAKTTIIKFLPSTLVSPLIPSDSLITLTPVNIEKNGFRASWKIGESSVYAKFQLPPNSAILNYVQIGVTSPNTFVSSAEIAEKITPEFFSINTQGEWKCKEIKDSFYCENFWQDKSDTKRRVYLNSPLETPSNRKDSNIVYCESHKDSDGSYPLNGCISILE